MSFGDWAPFDTAAPPPDQVRASSPRPKRVLYESAAADRSLRRLAATGANWIALIVRGGQETVRSTEIFYRPPATANDEDLRRTIDIVHGLGMRVMLKPHVLLSQDPTHNHTQIGTSFTLTLKADGWRIEKVYGSPEADEATGVLKRVQYPVPVPKGER